MHQLAETFYATHVTIHRTRAYRCFTTHNNQPKRNVWLFKKGGKEAEKKAKKREKAKGEFAASLVLSRVCLVLVIAPIFSIAIDDKYTIDYRDVFNAYLI